MATYIISDLHLNESSPAIAGGFIKWLSNLSDAETLYILGDFFEHWIGDDYSDAFIEEIKEALKTLSQSGCALYFMHGNRDFLIGENFCSEIGGTLLDENHSIELNSTNALLTHGDALCIDDVDYMKARDLFRNPNWQAAILSRSIEERLQLAQSIRKESNMSKSTKDIDIMDVNQGAVQELMDEHNIQLLIHGHTHRPKIHQWKVSDKCYIRMVLGDWDDKSGWYIRFTSTQSPELVHFNYSDLSSTIR